MDWSIIFKIRKTMKKGIWSDFAMEGLQKMMKEERRKKVFKRVVNPLILKHLVTTPNYNGTCIASGIPIKYLNYFKEVSAHKNAKKIRYRYRGKSGLKTQYKTGLQMHYIRPQSFCHMNGADTFAIYYR